MATSVDAITAPPQRALKGARFNVQNAVHIAYHAFSAYLEPVEGRQLQELSPDNSIFLGGSGTKKQFFSRNFLRQHYQAAVTVSALRGQGLGLPKPGNPRSDPPDVSVEITSGSSFGSSREAKSSHDPTWTDELTLWPRLSAPLTALKLQVNVIRRDSGGAPELLGTAELPMPPLQEPSDTEHELVLQPALVTVPTTGGAGGDGGRKVMTSKLLSGSPGLVGGEGGVEGGRGAAVVGTTNVDVQTSNPSGRSEASVQQDVGAGKIGLRVRVSPLQGGYASAAFLSFTIQYTH
jgi:hypothetical protein